MNIPKDQPEFKGTPEHLELLFNALEKRDITIWNNWRKENSDIVPDLSDGDFSDIINLCGIDFHKSIIRYASFNASNLEGADFRDADCEGTGFGDAVLRGIKADNARLCECNFIMADCSEACLENANLCNSTLMHTKLTGANLTGIKCRETHLVNCIITGMTCKYILFGEQKFERFPKDRDFLPEELEKLFSEQQFVTEETLKEFSD